MKKLVIFGCGEIGQLAHFYFSSDSSHSVVGFTVDPAYASDSSFCGLPIAPFDRVQEIFPPAEHDAFVALSYAQLNELRTRKVEETRSKGYRITKYVSSRATVLTREPIGDNCFILENNTVQPFSKVGQNVTLWSGNHIGHHSEIGDGCFITSHVVISGGAKVGPKCFIGVNATIRDHISIGASSIIGAGAIIMSDVAPGSVFRAGPTVLSPVPSSRLKGI